LSQNGYGAVFCQIIVLIVFGWSLLAGRWPGRGQLFGALGSRCAPSQNTAIYHVLATFPPPGGLLFGTLGAQSDTDGALTAKMDAKVYIGSESAG